MFWKSAVLTFIVLVLGIQLGIWLDSGRLDEIKKTLTETEIEFSDARLQAFYLDNFMKENGQFCDSAFRANLAFNQKIYDQGKQLERYELVNRFGAYTPERQRYALLQLQFWMNALRIKELCRSDYTTVLYIYRLDTVNATEVELPQKLQSAALLELKEKCGPALMLSPVPLDMGLSSIDLVVRQYAINETPALIINDNIVLKGLTGLDELEKLVKC